jgi:conjugal transfer pilus assembly protein TraV
MSRQSPTLFAISAAVLFLSGCANSFNPIGEGKFDCNRKQDPKSPLCRSFKSVEASTATPLPQSRFDVEFKISDYDRLTGIAPDDPAPAAQQPTVNPPVVMHSLPHQAKPTALPAGTPVREGPVVQRVWVKRFVDDRDLLTESTIVYKEIRPTQWSGFRATAQSAAGVQGGVYPHKTPKPVPEPLNKEASARPDFKQPGLPLEAEDTAPAPAESGVEILPQ